MRPLILGHQNPHDDLPDLSPRRPGTSGWRLWKMLNGRTGISMAEYERAFRFNNLENHTSVIEGVVVVLGDHVRRAVGIDKILIHPQVVNGVEFRLIPHPSGRCLFYNEPLNRELVAMMLEDLMEGPW